jgi:DNA-binding NarL/FixJ family response regulator
VAVTRLDRWLLPLTPRMIQVVDLAVRGATDWDIGQALGTSASSVASQLHRARELLEISNRTELAAVYWQTAMRDVEAAPCSRCGG